MFNNLKDIYENMLHLWTSPTKLRKSAEFNESLTNVPRWNCTMNVTCLTVLLQGNRLQQKSPICTPPHLIICMKVKQLVGLENSLFWKITIALSLIGLTALLYFLHIFKSSYISYVSQFLIFMLPLPLTFFFFRVLRNKLSPILSISSRIIVYLCKRIIHLKITIHGKSLYFTISGKK